ncbi:hypothetical protein EI427_09305 [Flammeovirga pectinis]|uniref:Uncharacterized protein n=1 Tax=Flammeovirga pectinis TaxID=2494373 RepID=A0A3Q9FQU2_9BACT|nr:hypothetical protein [Flammeovirga pectinis]AZQ62426.1 hypothetical protein EI427_09305 [Flammeovirga pectinis]
MRKILLLITLIPLLFIASCSSDEEVIPCNEVEMLAEIQEEFSAFETVMSNPDSSCEEQLSANQKLYDFINGNESCIIDALSSTDSYTNKEAEELVETTKAGLNLVITVGC